MCPRKKDDKNMRKQINKIKLLIFLSIFMFIIINLKFGQVLAVEEGTKFLIPNDLPQYSAQFETEDINWNETSKQYKVNQTWKEQGKPGEQAEEPINCAYLTLAGEKRYLIALTPTFGEAGDYIDVYIQDGNEEKVYKCVMGDAKGRFDNEGNDVGYYYNGIFMGHKYPVDGVDKCDILEFLLKDASGRPSGDFMDKFANITVICNRGSYFEHPEGPVDIVQTKTMASGESENIRRVATQKKSDNDTSITNVLGNILAEIVDSIATSIENLITGGDETSVLVAKVDEGSDDASTGSGASPAVPAVGDADIMRTCEQLTRYLMNKNVNYGNRTNNNLDENYNNPDYNINCAIYTAIVLWKTGKLSKDTINKHGYWAANDIAEMAAAERWQKLNANDKLIEGDILVNSGEHVAIYAGDGKVWDEYTAVIEKDDNTGRTTVPTGAPYPPKGGFTQFDVRYRPPQ